MVPTKIGRPALLNWTISSITPLNFEGTITITPYVDGDVKNQDSNYDEKFWEEVEKFIKRKSGYLTTKTKKTDFHVCTGMKFEIFKNGEVGIAQRSVQVVRDQLIDSAIVQGLIHGSPPVVAGHSRPSVDESGRARL